MVAIGALICAVGVVLAMGVLTVNAFIAGGAVAGTFSAAMSCCVFGLIVMMAGVFGDDL